MPSRIRSFEDLVGDHRRRDGASNNEEVSRRHHKARKFVKQPNQFAFNIQWHYALDITGNSDKDAYVCPKSIWNIRRMMSEHDLYQPVFEQVTDHLAKVFDADCSLQRLDSVHIFSNMRHLGRIGIFVLTFRT